MTNLDTIVSLTITKESSALKLPGFGTPLILPASSEIPGGFTERLRYYSAPSEMLTDGFVTTDRAYIMANILMSQRPRPDRFAVGRRDAAVAQSQVFTLPVTPDNSATYHITINGEDITAATDGSATRAELLAAFIASINGSEQAPNVTAAASGVDLIVTSDTAGVPFTFSIGTATTADITAGAAVANVGIAEDLAAIIAYQNDWYCLLIAQRDAGNILVAAGAIEALRKIFIAQSNDAEILATPYDAGDTDSDIASTLHALGYERTALVYDADDAAALDAALVGRCLPPVPGSITWKFKQLTGVIASSLSTTQYTNLTSKSANALISVAGISMFAEGTVASGEFIDITHGIDKLYSRVQELTAAMLIRADKIPFTQRGLNALADAIKAALDESVRDGVIADSRTLASGDIEAPAYSITPPKIEDIASSDRELRRIPTSSPYKFEATFAGAVHKVRIEGRLSF